MPEKSYAIKLDNVFEGPLDLLVYLIRKNEVDIYDIPVALITKQYLQYLELMQLLNIDLAGDFIVMASTLAQIKSKMMLPVAEDEDIEDPRLEITRPLLEYLQMKSAAGQLSERNILGEDIFVRNSGKEDFFTDQEDEIIKVGLFELIDAFGRILDRISPEQKLDFTADKISVKDKIAQLIDVFEDKGSLTFEELFNENVYKGEIIVTFLAVLEMVKLNLLGIAQQVQTGIIRLFYI